MKHTSLFTIIAVLTGGLIIGQAAPKDDVIQAAKKLAQTGNYSWTSTMSGGNRMGGSPTKGQIGKDGLAVITMTRQDNTMQMVVKGEKGAIQTQDGWQSLSELEGGTEPGWGRFMGAMLRNFKAPAVQAEEIATKAENLAMSEGAYAGKLTTEGAKELLSFRGRGGGQGPEISNAKGTVKFWIKNGTLSKFEYSIQGTMTFNNNEREIDRTMTIEISDVGTTKVVVPAGAQGKLN